MSKRFAVTIQAEWSGTNTLQFLMSPNGVRIGHVKLWRGCGYEAVPYGREKRDGFKSMSAAKRYVIKSLATGGKGKAK